MMKLGLLLAALALVACGERASVTTGPSSITVTCNEEPGRPINVTGPTVDTNCKSDSDNTTNPAPE